MILVLSQHGVVANVLGDEASAFGVRALQYRRVGHAGELWDGPNGKNAVAVLA
jgi:hypothetical protein